MGHVGIEIGKARKARGLTQKQLAKKVCCARAYLARIETCKGDPSLKFMQKIADALDMQLFEFFNNGERRKSNGLKDY